MQNLQFVPIPENGKFNEMEKCMPTPPSRVAREFVKHYFTVMSCAPENLYCFYTDSADFLHDDIDPTQRRTIVAHGKQAIHDEMIARSYQYHSSRAKVANVETMETLEGCLLVQVNGEISFNEQAMRSFSQTIILVAKTPFHYFVQNDIFRFCDFETDAGDSMSGEPIVEDEMLPAHCEPEQVEPSDWGTQCSDYVEQQRGVLMQQQQTVPRAVNTVIDTGAPENEVKLDTSGDSGLSSDAEKVIIDIQSMNLKNILQEKPTIPSGNVLMRSAPTPPDSASYQIEQQQLHRLQQSTDSNSAVEFTAHKSSLFQDACILTIGNVVNPNIEFEYDAKCDDETRKSDSPNGEEKIDENNSSSNDTSTGKSSRNRKRKYNRKNKHDISQQKSIDDSIKEDNTVQLSAESNGDCHWSDDNKNKPIECPSENAVEQVAKSDTSESPSKSNAEQETPTVKKSYAELARSGNDEWIDVMPQRRESIVEKPKQQYATLPRRNSRSDKATPPNGKHLLWK